jgi:hypothetical protein
MITVLSRRLSNILVLSVLFAGCNFRGTKIDVPVWDPVAAADRAMKEYDSNGDKKLSRDELTKCAGLAAAREKFDGDGDGSISADELTSKLQEIRQQESDLVEVTCTVSRGNQPVEGAKVEFVPESFMGEACKPASGITGRDGVTSPTIADEDMPAAYRGRIHGTHCGVYRVVVTHPSINIPAKYNKQTQLGLVVTTRNREMLTINF